MLSVETVLDESAAWINIIEDSICILLVRGSKSNHLVALIGLLKALEQVRTDVYASICILSIYFVIIKRDPDHDIWLLILWISFVQAMNHRFINIQDKHFLE